MEIIGYKYNTEIEAKNSIKMCNDYYGIPISPNDITQNWTNYQEANLNNPTFYYIIFDESLKIILGEPLSFEIVTPPPFE